MDPEILAGAIDVALDSVLVEPGASTEFTLANRGGGALTLAGATLEGLDARVEIAPNPVPPGVEARVRVTPTGDVPDGLRAMLCLASDDPTSPRTEVQVERLGVQPPLGEPAPDFTLPDLDGVPHTLSDTVGSPVLLVYFATW